MQELIQSREVFVAVGGRSFDKSVSNGWKSMGSRGMLDRPLQKKFDNAKNGEIVE